MEGNVRVGTQGSSPSWGHWDAGLKEGEDKRGSSSLEGEK